MFFNTTVQGLKSKMFPLEKIKDDPNAVRFYIDLGNYDALIAVFKGCVHYIFASLFFCVQKRALVKQGKISFVSLRKLFSFLR